MYARWDFDSPQHIENIFIRITPTLHNLDAPPAIDLEIHTSNELALVTSQVQGSIGNIIRIRQPAQWNRRRKFLAVLRRVVHADKRRE